VNCRSLSSGMVVTASALAKTQVESGSGRPGIVIGT